MHNAGLLIVQIPNCITCDHSLLSRSLIILVSYQYYCIVSQPLRLDGSVDKHPFSVATLDTQQQYSWFAFHQKVPPSYIPVAISVYNYSTGS